MRVISGVYIILCIANGKRYVGSSINIKQRWKKHRNTLNRNQHGNKAIQNSYNKYGAESFKYMVLEECPHELLIEREQYYIDLYQPEFNFRDADLRVVNDKMRKRVSDLHKSSGHKPTKEASIKSIVARSKLTAQYDPKTGELLCVFSSIAEAARTVGGAIQNIHAVMDKPNRTSYGYKWAYY